MDALGFRSLEFERISATGAVLELTDWPGEVPRSMATGDAALAALAGLDFPAEAEGADRLPGLTRQEMILRRAGRDPSLYHSWLGRLGPALREAFESCPRRDAPAEAAAWLDLVDRTFVEALTASGDTAVGAPCPVLGEAIGLGWGPLTTLAGQLVRTLSGAADAMLFLRPGKAARHVIEIVFGDGVDPRKLLSLRATVNRREPPKQALSVTQKGPKLQVWIDESVTDFALGWVALRLFVEGTFCGHVGVMFRLPATVAPCSDIAIRRVAVRVEEGALGAVAPAAADRPVTEPGALPSAIHCVVPVWGSAYVTTFLAAALPSHLAAGNLPALRGTRLIYEIYTDAEGREAIAKHPLFSALHRIVDEVVFFDTRQFRLEERTQYQLVLNYTIMNKAHQTAIGRASAHGGALLFLNCDTVYSDGVFARVAELLRKGYRTVENLSIRTDRDEMLAALAPLESPDGVLSIASAELTRLALPRLHWIARGRFWEGPPGLTIPDNLYWWVADSAILARATHFMPLVVFPRLPDIRYLGTIDHGFVPAAGIAESERWLMAAPAEPSSYELSLTSHDQFFPHYERGSVRDLARFLSLQCEYQHLRNLERPVRISAEPVSAARWREITEKSGAVLGQIRQRLQKYVLTAWRPDGATEAEECALVWQPPGRWRDPRTAAAMPDETAIAADATAPCREGGIPLAGEADAELLRTRAAE